MIKNIFLDAGGVILDEKIFEENYAKIITNIIQELNKDYSIKDYWNDVDEAVYRFIPKVYDYILYKHIRDNNVFNNSKSQYKNELQQLGTEFNFIDGIQDFLEKFSKHYNIGIIGQYGKDFNQFLEDNNVLQYFTFSEIQDDYNITKPNPKYFEAVLEKCKCKANESIMVGDRIDKDIIPAKMVGMKTIKIKVGIHKNQEPRIPEEIPDLTVNKIEDIEIELIKKMDYYA